MQATESPAVGRRRLAQELRRLRSVAGLTISDVAGRLECSAGKISRIETGAVGAQATDVRAMLDLYGVSGTDRDALADLVRLARRPAWWHQYADVVPAESSRFFGLEDGAVSIDQHAGSLVPGLLQTPAYARAVLSAPADVPAADVERRIELRLRRQQLLARPHPPRLHVLLDEAALRREVGGPEVLAGQLDRLASLATEEHVVLQVLPFGAGGAHQALGVAFTVFGFADPADARVVYLEQLTGNALLESAEEVGGYRAAFAESADRALDPGRSADLLRALRPRGRSPQRPKSVPRGRSSRARSL
jgi:transcriptional regulator with XRE-family HTH domain